MSESNSNSNGVSNINIINNNNNNNNHHHHSSSSSKEEKGRDLGLYFLEVCRRRGTGAEEGEEKAEEAPSELNTINSSGGFVVVSTDKLSVKYTNVNLHGHDVGVIQANKAAPTKLLLYYFEIYVKDAGAKGQIAIGFTSESFKMRRQPGWEANSCGYHGDDGLLYRGHGKGEPFGPTYTSGDIVGAGINYAAQEFFFTKNGQVVGTVYKDMKGPLFPTIAVHSQNEEVHVNFGQKPFTFDLKEFEVQERMKQQLKIEELPLTSNVSYGIVRSYLLHYGYEDTLNSFDVASRSTVPPIYIAQENGVDEQEIMYALNHRKTLRQLIRDGEIDTAFGKLREWYPQIVEDNTSAMCFLLHCQKFIELVRIGALEEAVKYGRIELSSFFGLPVFEDLVQDCVALLAYEQPLESPVGYLLKDSQREVVADTVNALILSTNPNMKESKNCLHSYLERLLRQLTACCLENRSLSGEQGEAFQLHRVLSSGKRG
ncbi:ran-binding protein M homolog [Arachis stenosperma]|uniref:ran-binding protein M homolog n=1 Tax=Arachis stenosperma TaxID=217475 RepID=UPI0025AC8F8D|nr:ran-binding protein M homolog [Arachis stenosperma]QHO56077.1 Ran-binding protein [Arachis hypogaea]